MIIAITLILIVYVLFYRLFMLQEFGFRPTAWSHLLRLVGLEKRSNLGNNLLQKIIHMKSRTHLVSEFEVINYKNFGEFTKELLVLLQKYGGCGKKPLSALQEFIKIDLEQEREREALAAKGFSQFLIMGVCTMGFIFYAGFILKVDMPSWLLALPVIISLIGILLCYQITSKLIAWSLFEYEEILLTSLRLQVFSSLNLPIKQVVKNSDIGSLYSIKWKEESLEEVFIWLIQSIETWKNQGLHINESLEALIQQVLSLRGLKQRKLNSIVQGVQFFLILCLSLPTFFVCVGITINKYLAL